MNRRKHVVRVGTSDDVDWALELAPEMASFGLPPWREFDHFLETCRAGLRRALETVDPEDVVLVAVDGDGERVGLAHLVIGRNPTGDGRAVHIEDFAVTAEHRRMGIGSLLLAESERWAHDRGIDALVLAVFQDNAAARRFYARHGFRDDTVRVVKTLDDDHG
jgi:GNAT superfamily N-acetyltransferase